MLWNIRKIVKTGDYLYAVVPEHPKAIKYGYVLAHRIIMENKINRLLRDDEIVHHKNGKKHDNDINNLELMTVDEHNKKHSSERISHGRKRYEKGCRCSICTLANTERQRRYRISKKK